MSRPFELADRWCAALCEEFFRQGDLEAARGMKYTSDLNDREHLNKESSQIGFYKSVCLPLYQAVAKVLPYLEINVHQVESNLSAWIDAENTKRIAEEENALRMKNQNKEEEDEDQSVKVQKSEKLIKPLASEIIKHTMKGIKRDTKPQ